MLKGLVMCALSIIVMGLSLWGMVGILHIQQLSMDELFWRLFASGIGLAGSLAILFVYERRHIQ